MKSAGPEKPQFVPKKDEVIDTVIEKSTGDTFVSGLIKKPKPFTSARRPAYMDFEGAVFKRFMEARRGRGQMIITDLWPVLIFNMFALGAAVTMIIVQMHR